MNDQNLQRCIACGSRQISTSDYLISERYPLKQCQDCKPSFLDFKDEESDFLFEDYWDDVNKQIYAHPKVVAELRQKYRFYLERL